MAHGGGGEGDHEAKPRCPSTARAQGRAAAQLRASPACPVGAWMGISIERVRVRWVG